MAEAQENQLDGHCACGAVSFRADVQKTYGVCHCEMCRRWTGGTWFGVLADANTRFDGPLKVWSSSRIADRGYCGECGSSVFHRPKIGGKITIGQGLFADQKDWRMARQIFSDRKPDHYTFGGVAPSFTAWGTIIAYLLGKLPK